MCPGQLELQEGSELLGRCCRDSQGSTWGGLPQKHPWELIPVQKIHVLTQVLLPKPSQCFWCWDGFFWYLEGFSSFKWKPGSCPLLLPPDILEFGIADDDFLVVFLEAGVEVEGNIIPSLEIQ